MKGMGDLEHSRSPMLFSLKDSAQAMFHKWEHGAGRESHRGVREEEHVLQAHVGADRLRLRCQTESIWISLTRHFPIRNTRKTNIKMAILGTQFLGQATWPHFNLNHRCPDQTAQAWDSNEFEPAPHAPFFL